jgi:hypothetical protein
MVERLKRYPIGAISYDPEKVLSLAHCDCSGARVFLSPTLMPATPQLTCGDTAPGRPAVAAGSRHVDVGCYTGGVRFEQDRNNG